MHKKFYTVFIIAALLSFAACGASDSDKEPDSAVTATSALEKDALSSTFQDSEQPKKEDNTDEAANATASAGNSVVVDTEHCSFKILSMDTQNDSDSIVEVQLKNKTTLNLMFSIDNVSVNGVMYNPFWSCLVEAGQSYNTSILFNADELNKIGVSELTCLKFLLTVYDHDDWTADNLVSEKLAFYPSGEAAATVAQRTPQSTDFFVCDTEDFSIAITDFKPDNTLGYLVDAYFKNNTAKNLTFSFDEVYVNGYRCEPFWSSYVTSEAAAYETLYLYLSDLEENGIAEVTELQFKLSVYDEDDWAADYLLEDVFCFYPLGEAAASTHTRTPQENDIVLFDTEECTMIVTDCYMDAVWGYTLDVYLENKSSSSLAFSTEETYVNGIACDPFWIADLAPGKKYNTQITWSNYQLEESEITDVEELTFDVIVYDNDNWTLGELIYDTFTITP